MVNPNKDLPTWNNAAAGMWQQFFQSHIGSAGLERLAALRPPLSSDTLEKAALAGAEARGYEKCLAHLMGLTISDEAPKTVTTNTDFPPLDDEEAWKEQEKKQ